MTAFVLGPVASLDARDIAQRLRNAADVLDRGDWEAVFLAHARLGMAYSILDSFCDGAEQAGSAPSFLAVMNYAETIHA